MFQRESDNVMSSFISLVSRCKVILAFLLIVIECRRGEARKFLQGPKPLHQIVKCLVDGV